MPLRKIFCPECGQETQLNDEKPFCFCLQCGKKIVLHSEKENPVARADSGNKTEEIEKKLQEVDFYYKLSLDKGEDANYDEEPTYYLKAQDILVDLSQLYPEDYRIWWELCKPIDFNNASSATDIYERYCINEDYFGKALDKADLNEKKRLIKEHDRYISEKKMIKEKAEERRREEEKCREEEKHREEEKRRAEELERQKIEQQHQEEIQRKKIAEQQEQLRIQKEKMKQIAELSAPLWQALMNKDYQAIDNSFFNISTENNQIVIGIFKNVSNVMYLMAFHMDGNKSNNVYRDQTIAIKFDNNGHGLKFDDKPVRIKGMMPQQSDLFISDNGMGGLTVNDLELHQNTEYVTSIIKNAKKPLFAFTKYFF